MSAEPAIPLPRWAEIGRTACRTSVGMWAVLYVINFIIKAVGRIRNDEDFFSLNANTSWDWYEVVFVFGLLGTAVVGGVLWLAGEVVRGSREPRD